MPEEVAFGRPFLYLCPVLNSVGTFSRCFKENVMEQYVKRTQRIHAVAGVIECVKCDARTDYKKQDKQTEA